MGGGARRRRGHAHARCRRQLLVEGLDDRQHATQLLVRIDRRGTGSRRFAAHVQQVRAVGLPFWLAGSYGSAKRVREALALGAAGVQVGTAFALCRESGIDPLIKTRLI